VIRWTTGELDLSCNLLSESSPVELGNLTATQVLRLSYDRLRHRSGASGAWKSHRSTMGVGPRWQPADVNRRGASIPLAFCRFI